MLLLLLLLLFLFHHLFPPYFSFSFHLWLNLVISENLVEADIWFGQISVGPFIEYHGAVFGPIPHVVDGTVCFVEEELC